MRILCTFGVRGIVVNVSSHPENWSSVNGIEQTFICIHGGKSTLNENNPERERGVVHFHIFITRRMHSAVVDCIIARAHTRFILMI